MSKIGVTMVGNVFFFFFKIITGNPLIGTLIHTPPKNRDSKNDAKAHLSCGQNGEEFGRTPSKNADDETQRRLSLFFVNKL